MSEKILLIDDEELVLKMQSTFLQNYGYVCSTAGSADEASHLMSQQNFDLVLLDVNIPGRSGIELLEEIKRQRPETAVIMVTADENLDTALRCTAMGADDYILKPFNAGRVIISVRNTLEKNRLFQDNLAYQAQLEEKVAEQTEKIKASQAIAIQQEKLAAIGQLAAGVAHEINNPVGFIASNLNTLAKYFEKFNSYINEVTDQFDAMPESIKNTLQTKRKSLKIDLLAEDVPPLIAECLEGTERISNIVQGLKGFSRKDEAEASLSDINHCIESAVNICWNEIKYKATVERDFGELPRIRCYPQQLSQVFMNLLVNAVHAISEKGTIKISTRYIDDNLEITVSDTGCGISPENQSKIFDPFFTTKEHGKGTGLGMSIAYDIIAHHQGNIWFSSEVGLGTTFVILLPVVVE